MHLARRLGETAGVDDGQKGAQKGYVERLIHACQYINISDVINQYYSLDLSPEQTHFSPMTCAHSSNRGPK